MDNMISNYKIKIPELKKLFPKWEDNLFMALQHFQGFGGAKKYLEILKRTGSIEQADKEFSSPGNMSVSDYLYTFAK